ncbi:MAG: zinc ribbon domain-containing protein [bacterium]|nr:zinc ribbon domain-containing protein [bacterium]
MKYCTKCGNLLNDDDLFCPKCGTKQLVATMPEEPKEEIKEVIEEKKVIEPVEETGVEEKAIEQVEEVQEEIIEDEVVEEITQDVEDEPVEEAISEQVIEEVESEPEATEPKVEETVEEEKVESNDLEEIKEPVKENTVDEKDKEINELKIKLASLMEKEQTNSMEEKPIETVSEPKKAPEKNQNDLRATESVVLMVGYTVIFIIYCILNAKVFNEGSMIGKLGFLFATGVFTAVFIIKMVKSLNRKKQFLFVMNLTFAIIMTMFILANLIILSQS